MGKSAMGKTRSRKGDMVVVISRARTGIRRRRIVSCRS